MEQRMNNQTEGRIYSLFPTPLYTYKTENKEYTEIQTEMQAVVDKLYLENRWGQNQHWNTHTHYLSNQGNFKQSILKDETMRVITSCIMHHCFNYMRMMDVKPCYKAAIETSWLTLTKPGQYAHIHDHGTSHVSGVYWFKTNGQDGDIVFRNALKSLKCNPIGSSYAHENAFAPEQGRLSMWPGYLDHGVNENTTSEDRISLSFNILLETGATN
jgi:uncharacterized protein (TIGR02466 family)